MHNKMEAITDPKKINRDLFAKGKGLLFGLFSGRDKCGETEAADSNLCFFILGIMRIMVSVLSIVAGKQIIKISVSCTSYGDKIENIKMVEAESGEATIACCEAMTLIDSGVSGRSPCCFEDSVITVKSE